MFVAQDKKPEAGAANDLDEDDEAFLNGTGDFAPKPAGNSASATASSADEKKGTSAASTDPKKVAVPTGGQRVPKGMEDHA